MGSVITAFLCLDIYRTKYMAKNTSYQGGGAGWKSVYIMGRCFLVFDY